MHLQEMDPSMLIAFLVKDYDDWIDWVSRIDEVTIPRRLLRNLLLPTFRLLANMIFVIDWKNCPRGYSYI
jgi:hypothetical protein